MIKRWLTGALASLTIATALTTPATAQTITDGDNGIVEKACDFRASQIQLDTSSRTGPTCFETTGTGWARMNVGEVYGVYNRSEYPVTIAFRLPEGQVFWQETIAAGSVRTLDIDRSRSRVIEMIIGSVASSTGQGSGILQTGESVTFSRRHVLTPGALGFDVFGDNAQLRPYGVNSGFEDRLDATFILQPGLSDPSCFSLETANYTGVYLTADVSGAVARQVSPQPDKATWCFTEVDGNKVRIQIADGTGRWLENILFRSVSLERSSSDSGIWSLDAGLADPQ